MKYGLVIPMIVKPTVLTIVFLSAWACDSESQGSLDTSASDQFVSDRDASEVGPDLFVDMGPASDMELSDAEVSEDAEVTMDQPLDSGPPPEIGRTPIFADYFTPQNVNGSILERWSVQEICSPTQAQEGVYCVPITGGSSITTRFSTLNYEGLKLSYVRIPNVDGRFAGGDRFIAEWSADGEAPWVEIESSAATDYQAVSFDLPIEAEGHIGFSLRFRAEGEIGEGKSFWMNNVVVTAAVPKCNGHTWTNQYAPPYDDINGEFMGGSEIFRILPHNGELFATNTYWMDENNPWCCAPNWGGSQWSQILRKTDASSAWREDYELGQGVLRPEVLRSVTFTQPEPDINILLASTFRDSMMGRYYIDVWTRDDATQTWDLVTPHEGDTPGDPHDISVRQLVVHIDTVTGEEKIILPVGTQGMLEGVYDPSVSGKIRWESLIPVAYNERVMGMTIANNVVVVGAGNQIWHRIDGAVPRYEMVHDMEDLIVDEALQPPMGTYRGMSTIPTPHTEGESVIFSWSPDYRSTGTIYRLDPEQGGYRRVAETDIGDLLAADLGVPVWVSLCTYSYFLPVTDPETGEGKHLGGCLNTISAGQYPIFTGSVEGVGIYKGGIYFIRHADGSYTLREVAGRHNGTDAPRDSIRAIAVSPFAEDDQIYFGGHDSAGVVSTNMAWMYSASARDALEVCAD